MIRTTEAKGVNQNATDRLNKKVDEMAHDIVFRKVTSPL
jgi:hypothetical protein